jgi:glucose/arabinose dehydrogenase
VWRGPRKFSGFNGLAFGPDGRIYAGVSLNMKYDHAKSPQPYAQRVVSLRPNGTDFRTVARGLRQPFQLAFVKGNRYPYVTVLSQDLTKRIPPDYIVVTRPGQDYGFPKCTWIKTKPCRPFAKPKKFLPKHASPMGIAAIGQKLYIALFGGLKGKPEVVTWSLTTGRVKPFLTGFVAPVVGLGVNGGSVYVGDLTGSIYRVRG